LTLEFFADIKMVALILNKMGGVMARVSTNRARAAIDTLDISDSFRRNLLKLFNPHFKVAPGGLISRDVLMHLMEKAAKQEMGSAKEFGVIAQAMSDLPLVP
jgi:hypothetical protein